MTDLDDDVWAESWLDRNYGGAPDECSRCYKEGLIVKTSDCSDSNHK